MAAGGLSDVAVHGGGYGLGQLAARLAVGCRVALLHLHGGHTGSHFMRSVNSFMRRTAAPAQVNEPK